MAANDLITAEELALWTQSETDEVEADPFATEVMEKVSEMARFFGGHADWTRNNAPFDVKMVVLQVCKRTYSNPDQEVQTSTGPISSRVLQVAALLLALTPTEKATLTKYNPDGDPDAGGGLWILRPTPEPGTSLSDVVLFVPDDSLSDWYIPMFSTLDPGDPDLYPEG